MDFDEYSSEEDITVQLPQNGDLPSEQNGGSTSSSSHIIPAQVTVEPSDKPAPTVVEQSDDPSGSIPEGIINRFVTLNTKIWPSGAGFGCKLCKNSVEAYKRQSDLEEHLVEMHGVALREFHETGLKKKKSLSIEEEVRKRLKEKGLTYKGKDADESTNDVSSKMLNTKNLQDNNSTSPLTKKRKYSENEKNPNAPSSTTRNKLTKQRDALADDPFALGSVLGGTNSTLRMFGGGDGFLQSDNKGENVFEQEDARQKKKEEEERKNFETLRKIEERFANPEQLHKNDERERLNRWDSKTAYDKEILERMQIIFTRSSVMNLTSHTARCVLCREKLENCNIGKYSGNVIEDEEERLERKKKSELQLKTEDAKLAERKDKGLNFEKAVKHCVIKHAAEFQIERERWMRFLQKNCSRMSKFNSEKINTQCEVCGGHYGNLQRHLGVAVWINRDKKHIKAMHLLRAEEEEDGIS